MFARLTAFGKALRNFRMDNGLSLKDMAEALDYSSPFVSAVELGKKSIPDGFVEKLRSEYDLSDAEYQNLRNLADVSAKEIKMDIAKHTPKDRDLIATFARRFEKLNENQKEAIMKTIKSGGA